MSATGQHQNCGNVFLFLVRYSSEEVNIAVRAFCFVLAAIAFGSCNRVPDSFPLPEQQPRIDDPQTWERMVRMTDVDARDTFVADIFEPLAANWRWAGKNPTIRLMAPPHLHRAYRIEFAIPEQAFRVTGPVELKFLVNGHVLGRERYTAVGSYIFEKEVPPEWIADGGPVTLGAEIDKVQTAPNRNPYGFLMVAMGLKRSG